MITRLLFTRLTNQVLELNLTITVQEIECLLTLTLLRINIHLEISKRSRLINGRGSLILCKNRSYLLPISSQNQQLLMDINAIMLSWLQLRLWLRIMID
mgnify:CR=1 FL=1